MQPLWQPTSEYLQQTNITKFINYINQNKGQEIANYKQLWQWSTEEISDFWQSFCEFANIQFDTKASSTLVLGENFIDTEWFKSAELNYAKHLLQRQDDKVAIIFRSEIGKRTEISYKQLYKKVAQLQTFLKQQGVQKGDRVAGYLPNLIETIIASLATSALGAIWSSCSPEFGLEGVSDRFGQIEPKVMITVDGYSYGGKKINNTAKVNAIVERIPSIETLVVIPFLDSDMEIELFDKGITWDSATDNQAQEVEFVPLPFNHPLFIMYSSGTTGVPKCIVHGTGGTLLQHLKELTLHTDITPDSRLMYYTTCGWMMWNWMISTLATGASLVLFEGSPFYPGPDALWRIIKEEKITAFGTSAKYIAALENENYSPNQYFSLKSLKTLLSTGSPLSPTSFVFVYRAVKKDIHLASISGGTDIISCFALGAPTLPVYSGELQCRGLGMAVDVFNEEGQSVTGEKGELVCTKPFPSAPIGFWNDKNNEKYLDAYFNRFAGVWAHGDYAEITQSGGLIIHGRSDTVLNPGGVRIGTAEIYRQLDTIESVKECIVIGQNWQQDVRIVLFVVMQSEIELDDATKTMIKQRIRQNTTPRHVPAKIIQVADIPKTITGKLVELAVRNVVHGLPVSNIAALANPEALANFANHAELES
jgi:acetoacetyl-CoA synthetase